MPDNDKRRSAGTLQTRRQPLPWPVNKEFRILSIDGGGIRGILPAAVLGALENTFLKGGNVGDCFDLITGTSTGGILALGLAKGLTAQQLLHLYLDRGDEIFPNYDLLGRWQLLFRSAIFARCDRGPLDRLIDEILGTAQLWEAKKRLCIPAVDAQYGEVFVFKTPHHPDFKMDWKDPMAKAARATSAAPAFFRPVSDGTYTYLDGGIWAINPVMVGVVDALAAFDVGRDRVKVLSLGCVDGRFQIRWYHKILGGYLMWPKHILQGAMHLQSMNALGQAGLLIGRDRLLRVNYPPIKPTLEMDDWARCRAVLPEKAAELVEQYGERIKTDFLYGPADPYSPVYTPSRPPS